MLQIKEQTFRKKLNEIEIRNQPEQELKIMIIKMLATLEKIMDEHSEIFNKERIYEKTAIS